MKILFNTSVTGRDEYEENYKAIDLELNKLGHEVISPVFIAWKEDVQAETESEAETYYRNLQKWMRDAEVFVFEVSYPSLGVGHEITWALQLGKPVIVLHVKGKNPVILEVIPNDKLQVVEYDRPNLVRLLKDAIGYAADQQDTRFNFFISPKHQNYLNWISKHRKIPRAVFLRDLIDGDMVINKDYDK
jgi:2'-deoxynucleoside 5'-phosphate N-hydrolase